MSVAPGTEVRALQVNKRPRDAEGWSIPAEGTKARRVYDLAKVGKTDVEIGVEIGMQRCDVAAAIRRMRHPDEQNSRARQRDRKRSFYAAKREKAEARRGGTNGSLLPREQKLEAMARAWCTYNGWAPDHRPLVLKATDEVLLRPGDERPLRRFLEEDGEPIWKAHIKAMDHLLKAIGE